MRAKRRAGDVDVINGVAITRGSENVYSDIGFPHAEEWAAKAVLAGAVLRRCAGMTQRNIAARLGIDQPKVSAMINGQFEQFSVERLMTFVRRIGQDVEIHVRQSRRVRALAKRPVLGRLSVVSKR